MVGRHTKQKKSHQIVWGNYNIKLPGILINRMVMKINMRNPIKTFLFIIVWLGCSSAEQRPENNTAQAVVTIQTNELPEILLTRLDGSQFSAKTLTGNLMLIFYSPDCDHCQREAQQIEKRLKDFKDYKLYLVSSATTPEIQKFSKDYKLTGKPNVEFVRASPESVLNSLGAIELPSIYVYSKGKLINAFNGEVELDVVFKYI